MPIAIESKSKARVYVCKVGSITRSEILEALDWIHWTDLVVPGARVFIKPNLTLAQHVPGVTTTPAFINAVISALKVRTDRIVIGESSGGYHSYEAEAALRAHGVYEFAERHGARVVNLSKEKVERVSITADSQEVQLDLPAFLLHEVDAFITMPVPKVHAMTRVSLAFKNQWGCQPDTMRMRYHASFNRRILALNQVLMTKLAIYDGTYFLDKNGPTHGEAVPMNLLIASNDIGAGDAVCCGLMGIDPRSVPHYRLAMREGIFPRSLQGIALNQPMAAFPGARLRLERSLVNYVALVAFKSRWLTYLLYESPVGKRLHRIFYTIRKNKYIGRALHGRLGPPQAIGSARPTEKRHT